MSLRPLIIGCALVALSAISVAAQETSDWGLTSASPLEDVVGSDYDPRSPILSPDGSAVAWWDANVGQPCVYRFDDEETTCYEGPETLPDFGRYSYPTWSPDGRLIAFTESFFDRLLDGDVWVLDVESGEITNRTDDEWFGGLLDDDTPEDLPIDYLPTWNPATGDLYFFRSTVETEGDRTTALYQLVEGDEPQRIVDVSASLPILSIFRRTAISPDGTQMAVIVLAQDPTDEQNGIYLITLADGTLTKVADLDAVQAGLPAWAIEMSRMMPETLFWVGNEALVIVSSDGQFATPLSENTVYLDLTSGDVTPMADLTQIEQASDLLVTSEDLSNMIRIGGVVPDHDVFLALRFGPNLQGTNVAVVSLPPVGEAALASELSEFQIVPGSLRDVSVSVDGKILMFGWLFTFENGDAS